MLMAQQRQLVLVDQRAATPRLCWLTLAAPELAHNVRAGQYLLVRCADVGSYDPLLRRALFVAAAEPALGQIGLLYEPNERGLAWLARGRPGDLLDIVGPLGQPFAVHERTRNLLLIGEGPGLPALLLLARESAARGRAVTLIVGAADVSALPPPYLLPGEVEYQSIIGPAVGLLAGATAAPRETRRPEDQETRGQDPFSLSPLAWADQVCVALPGDQLSALRDAIRAIKYRWERGFASALLEGQIVCGVGACGVCAVELRKRTRMLCSDGPVFDLRDVGHDG
jgi:dihydroorotate dehydrogenase electron transfer subunit